MIYGTPSVKVVKDITDRIGIRTLVLSQLWAPSAWPLTIEELDAEEPDVPAVPGGVLLIGQNRLPERGGFRTYWTFEGIGGDGKSVTFRDRTNSLDYWFEPGFSEKNILKLPWVQTLLNQLGGYVVDGQVIWPPTIPNSAATGPIVGGTAGATNPMYGQDTFFSLEGTYHFRYATANLSGIPDNTGKILQSGGLPGQVKSYPDRNWLALPAAPKRVGPVYDVLESFWLSGRGGWPTPAYVNPDAS